MIYCKDHSQLKAQYFLQNPNNPKTTGFYCEPCILDWISGEYEEPLGLTEFCSEGMMRHSWTHKNDIWECVICGLERNY